MSDQAVKSLDQLAEQIKHQHGLVTVHLKNTLDRMIDCGHLLIEAQDQVPRGQWVKWSTEKLGIHRKTVSTYIRFARYQDLLVEHNVKTAIDARHLLGQLELPSANSSEHFAKEAQRMRAQGKSVNEIAKHFNVTHARVSQWTNRKKSLANNLRAQKKRAKANKLLKRSEDAKIVKKSGKELAEAYTLVRKALQLLSTVDDKSILPHVNSALRGLHMAEDGIVAASRGKEVK